MLWVFGALGIFQDGSTYALAFGVLFGLMELVPYVGPMLGALPPIIVAAFDDPLTAVWVGLGFLALQQLEGHVVAPQVFGRALRLNPLLVLFALLFGGEISGFVGALVALPIAAVLRETVVYLRRHLVLEPWGRRPLTIDGPDRAPGDEDSEPTMIRVRREPATRLPTRLDAERTAIRGVRPSDVDDLLELRLRNREFLAPWDPLRPASFFTRAGQAEWIALQQRAWSEDRGYGFAVLDTPDGDRSSAASTSSTSSAAHARARAWATGSTRRPAVADTRPPRSALRPRSRSSTSVCTGWSRRSCRATRARRGSWRRRASGARASPSATCGSPACGRTTPLYAMTSEDFAQRDRWATARR